MRALSDRVLNVRDLKLHDLVTPLHFVEAQLADWSSLVVARLVEVMAGRQNLVAAA